MYVFRLASGCIVAALLAISIAVAFNNAAALQRGPPASDDGTEILTRGPVHEAFAETVTFDPEPGLVAPKSPPPVIEELPPEQRPEGVNVEWIPGYWAWDDERNDFLWVSGIWRALPPDRQWVPGYWSQAGQGAQWTSGYWADAQASDVEYLPEPPATVEAGPNVAAPSADHNWLPGSWLWQQNRYAWRPGYWAAGQSDWNWVPAHYVWTPRGYVFVDGYYDYAVARRGVVFAPVYFRSGSYSQPGFSYSPTVAISPAVFGSHLFLRPAYGHYYYGDYYGPSYATAGYSSWQAFHSSRRGYDPFYAHQRWHHRSDRDWDRTVQADFQHRHDNESARPPRSWSDQARNARDGRQNGQHVVIAASLEELAKSKDHPVRFQQIDKAERQKLSQHGRAVAELRDQRQKLEVLAKDQPAAKTKASREFQPARAKLPRSPIAASPDRLGKDHVPPQRHEVLKPDLTVEPKSRGTRDKTKTVQRETKPVTNSPPAELPKARPRPNTNDEAKAPQPGRANSNPQIENKGNPRGEPRALPSGGANKSSASPPAQPKAEARPRGEAKSKGEARSPGEAKSNVAKSKGKQATSSGNQNTPPKAGQNQKDKR